MYSHVQLKLICGFRKISKPIKLVQEYIFKEKLLKHTYIVAPKEILEDCNSQKSSYSATCAALRKEKYLIVVVAF